MLCRVSLHHFLVVAHVLKEWSRRERDQRLQERGVGGGGGGVSTRDVEWKHYNKLSSLIAPMRCSELTTMP